MPQKRKNKIALVTGVTGQDGSYLAEFLLKKGYEVHGMVRRASTFNTQRIDSLKKFKEKGLFFLHYGDLADSGSVDGLMAEIKPDEVYNLGAQSHVRVSFDVPEYTANITGLGTLRMLEAMRKHCPRAKFYQASSSEMFGDVLESPQSEKTRFNAQSPYGIAKLFAHETAKRYRDAYKLFVSCGILFNHESERRGENFVSRKIAIGIANIRKGAQEKLLLGNLDAERDWGYAPEYVEAMWLMLQQKNPDDYVIATGETHTVREFAEEAFKIAGINIAWKGKGLNEKALDIKTGRVLIEIDPKYFRPNEVSHLCGDPSKAIKKLGWKPKTNFKNLVKIMTEYELKNLK